MNGLQVLGGFSAVVISLAYVALVNGWAVSLLWAWFMVPTFALPALTVMQAYGLMLVVRIVQVTPEIPKKEGQSFGTTIGISMAKSTVVALMFVGVGYIVKAFV